MRDGSPMAKRADAVTKARAAEPGTVLVINVEIEQGTEGLFYATSPDLKGLFVAAATVDELNVELPKVIKILIEKQTGDRWGVWPASKASEPEHIRHMWAAIPPHIAATALGNEGGPGRA
jgi:predicted RNase H-like HicB family nuclease